MSVIEQDRIKQQVEGVAAFLADAPAMGRLVPAVDAAMTGPYEVRITSGEHVVVSDEPRRVGGGDAGPTPVELALVALASCQAITYRIWAARLGIVVDAISVRASGHYDAGPLYGVEGDARPGFEDVRVEVDLAGPDPARFGELREAVDAHCPVLDVFRNPVPVTTG